ncbi:MAG: hypothetical protein IKI90_02385 [Treponema sp.]|nr:hypothetical protein [Treponema sp.]
MKDKNKDKVIHSAGIINIIVTVLYACVLLLMFSHISFKVLKENALEDLFVLFLSPNAERVIYWVVVIIVSSLISLSLFKRAFNSDLWRFFTFVAALVLCIFEIISFVSPLWGQVSIYLKMKSQGIPFDLNFQWSFVTTLMLIVALMRIFIFYGSVLLLSPKSFIGRVKEKFSRKS